MIERKSRNALLITAHHIYRNANLSVDQREQQVIEVQRRVVALQLDRGVDPQMLAAAEAEQRARTQLADQARRNTVEAHLQIVKIESQ